MWCLSVKSVCTSQDLGDTDQFQNATLFTLLLFVHQKLKYPHLTPIFKLHNIHLDLSTFLNKGFKDFFMYKYDFFFFLLNIRKLFKALSQSR